MLLTGHRSDLIVVEFAGGLGKAHLRRHGSWCFVRMAIERCLNGCCQLGGLLGSRTNFRPPSGYDRSLTSFPRFLPLALHVCNTIHHWAQYLGYLTAESVPFLSSYSAPVSCGGKHAGIHCVFLYCPAKEKSIVPGYLKKFPALAKNIHHIGLPGWLLKRACSWRIELVRFLDPMNDNTLGIRDTICEIPSVQKSMNE